MVFSYLLTLFVYICLLYKELDNQRRELNITPGLYYSGLSRVLDQASVTKLVGDQGNLS
jgi:hypothetical protein